MLALCAPVSLCKLQHLISSFTRHCCAFYSCHFMTILSQQTDTLHLNESPICTSQYTQSCENRLPSADQSITFFCVLKFHQPPVDPRQLLSAFLFASRNQLFDSGRHRLAQICMAAEMTLTLGIFQSQIVTVMRMVHFHFTAFCKRKSLRCCFM